MTESLDEAVAIGELTESQKQLILDKHAEIQAEREFNHDAMEDLTNEERYARMEEHKIEIESWAEKNGISMEYLLGGHGRKGGNKMMFRSFQ